MRRSADHSRLRRLAANALLIVTIALMAGGLIYRLKTSEDEALVVIDPTTLCRIDKPLSSSTAFLFDVSDPLSRTHQARLLARLREVRDTVPVGGKVILLLMNDKSPYEPRELISLCNPGRAKDTDGFRHNLHDAEKRWRDAFEKPLEDAVEKLGNAPTAKRSPILQSIVGLTQRPDFDGRVPNRRLVVASDGLQNDEAYSHYASRGNFWSAYDHSPDRTDPQPDLAGVRVDFEYLMRPEAARLQNQDHRQFWRQWLTNGGAVAVRFYGVPDVPSPATPADRAPLHIIHETQSLVPRLGTARIITKTKEPYNGRRYICTTPSMTKVQKHFTASSTRETNASSRAQPHVMPLNSRICAYIDLPTMRVSPR